MTIIALFMMCNAMLLGQIPDDGLTPEERLQNVLAIYHSQEVQSDGPEKAGYSLELNPLPFSVLYPCWRKDVCIPMPVTPRVVNSDGDVAPEAPPLPVTLADFHKPMRLAAPPKTAADLVSPTGTTVTFSSQGDAALKAVTGNGLTDFQLIMAEICRYTPGPDFSFGFVTQLANTIGIQTIAKDTGTAIIQQKVARNWKVLAPKVGTAVLAAFVGLTVGGVLPASIGWQRGLTFGHLTVDEVSALLKPTGPHPDPYLKNAADENEDISLKPLKCVRKQFSGVYSGPKTSFVTDRLQLLP